MDMKEFPKDRDIFFYWEGSPPRYNNVMTWWVEPKADGSGASINYGTGNLGRNGVHWEADFTIGRWHQLDMHIHWSEDPARGNVKLWWDGVVVLDKKVQTKGPQSTYFSQPGINRDPHTKSEDTIYFDDFLCATTLEEIEIQKPKSALSKEPSPPRFKAVAFDYFVIFDPNSVIPAVEEAYPGKGAEFTRAWRAKQFEYGFLRSITNRHADFFEVTEDALVYTAESLKLELPPEKRKRLLDAYLSLKPWPDAVNACALKPEDHPASASSPSRISARRCCVRTPETRGDHGPLRRIAEHRGQWHVQAGPSRLCPGDGEAEAQEGRDRLRRIRWLGRLRREELRLYNLLGEPIQSARGRAGHPGRFPPRAIATDEVKAARQPINSRTTRPWTSVRR